MNKEINKIPENFYWKTYVKLNPDLNPEISKKDAIKHFIKYGMQENRKYCIDIPTNFNWRGYIHLNRDLHNLNNKLDCLRHYIKYGFFENRKYEIQIPDDFYWEYYLENNPELKEEIKSENNAINHYIKKGFFENRIYCKIVDPTKELFTLPPCRLDEKYNTNNVEMITDNLFYDELHENDILRTSQFYCKDQNFLKFSLNENAIHKLNEFILVIDFDNGGGGTTFFLNTIISKYKYYQTFVILRYINDFIQININEEYKIINSYSVDEIIDFLDKYTSKISKIFVNHLFKHTSIFINKIFNLNKEVIGITHDYYNLIKNPQPFYHEIQNLIKKEKHEININQYSHIITQNVQNLYIFQKYFSKKITVVPLPDYLTRENDKVQYLDDVADYNKIVIGILGNIIDIKGKEILREIIEFYRNNKNIEIVIIGYTQIKNFTNYIPYNSIQELNNIILHKKINVFLELSLWPETYSYTLTLAMTTDLPIIYLDKNFYSVIKNRLVNYAKAYSFNTIQELDMLIKNYNQKYFYKINPIIYYSKFWNDLFISKTNKQKNKSFRFKYNINPYFIYFPQFHTIKENNELFYEKFNDIINLQIYNANNNVKLDQVNLKYLDIENIREYNLTDTIIIQKQIDLINDYGCKGFAMYYYWFSKNTITNKNMIMEKVIDIFFSNKINIKNKKIFFIWANENWTNNNAFGINKINKIENEYNNENFEKNANNLIQYFKHDNYLKINNKPVFFIYHSYLIENIDNFYDILNKLCINHHFNGVHLILNSFVEKNAKYKNFYINFNYKKFDARFYDERDAQLKISYKDYINCPKHVNEEMIQTIVFNFNNKPRLYKPDRLQHSTVCMNNSEFDKILFTNKLINSYNYKKTSEVENILLINSFNEWGENMSFEPSDKYGYYNLNLLFEYLTLD